MKICHVITRFIAGGAQENTLATVQGLAELGHQVTLISGPSLGSEGALLDFNNENLDFVFVEEPNLVRQINPWRDLLAYLKLKKYFKQNKFDVVHTHSSKAGILGRLAARETRRKNKTKVVHTIHGLAFDEYQSALKNTIYITLERLVAKCSDAIISVCDAMSNQALEAKIGAPEQFTTVYSGFDIERFQPKEKNTETLVLTTIGRLFDMKGSLEFVEIVEKLYQAGYTNVRGQMVGDGPLRQSLEARVKQNLPAGTIEFVGLVPPTSIPEYIQKSDLVVHASLREGLARVLPQSLACGVPVASYDIGGAKEVVKDGINGYICEANNLDQLYQKIESFVKDENIRKSLKNGAKKTDLTQFSNQTMAHQINALYQKIQSS